MYKYNEDICGQRGEEGVEKSGFIADVLCEQPLNHTTISLYNNIIWLTQLAPRTLANSLAHFCWSLNEITRQWDMLT